MKKVIFLLLAFITLNSNANTVTTLLDKTSEIVDSTKKTVKESITSVDTSSNFKMVYQDVKEGLSGLATGLKVGVEHVYIVLVKQQIVNSITWVIIYLLFIFICYLFVKNWNYLAKETDDVVNIIGSVVLTIILISLTFTLNETVMGFVNPEYGAIKDIINFVSNTSKTCSTYN